MNAYDITKGTVTSFTTQTLDVTVPDVTGQAQATAEGNIVAAGLTVGTVSSVCDASPAGTVLSQSPVGGGSVPPGTSKRTELSRRYRGSCNCRTGRDCRCFIRHLELCL
ncbi:MAG: PASTA domain-containing protein [Planctomycetota bacterium]